MSKKEVFGTFGTYVQQKKSTVKVSFCGANNKKCWGAAWFNGQSQRRCCSQFPADAGRRCQEVWRLLAGVWNSPGFCATTTAIVLVSGMMWKTQFEMNVWSSHGEGENGLFLCLHVPPEAHTHCLVRRVNLYISLYRILESFDDNIVYLHYGMIYTCISRMPPTFKPPASPPVWYCTKNSRILSDSKTW